MDLGTGAMGNLAPKLYQLLQGEYELQKGVRKKLVFLHQEMEGIKPALDKVAQVPWDRHHEQVKVWAHQMREASYDIEDLLDTFLVRVQGSEPVDQSRLKRALKKMGGLFGKAKARRDISGAIEDIKKQLQEVAERRDRCKIDEIVAKPDATSEIDPRLEAMCKEVTKLIGIDESKGELQSMLSSPQGNEVSHEKMKIVSVVGVGGLGKTTLAKAVYDELKSQFDCGAFVPVGRNPDVKKVLRDILIDLDKKEFREPKYDILDVRQLINELKDFLRSKRYFIVIDDVWETRDWKNIGWALVENDRGSIVIKTTRKSEVATGVIYQLRPLSDDDSKMLLFTRLFDGGGERPANLPAEACEKIMRKCDGVPLAIITMASMLVGKKTEDWLAVCNSPGFYRGNDGQQAHDTEWILSLSYYDLPMHLKTCLLYLSVYPEDYFIPKDRLIWKWIAEGFVETKTGTSLFQRGEEYFNQLVNRSMIQAVRDEDQGGVIYACQVHDMVLDLIRGLSYEENFVTISNDDEVTSPSGNKVRRLAHQNRVMKQLTQQEDDTGMARVRSLVACRCDIKSWVLHPSFKLLRVLALERCKCEEGWQGLKHLGDLLHLRYLGLHGINELPEEIGKLKFLQTLDLDGSGIRVLPFGVCQLTQLVCLRGGISTCAPDGLLKKVTSLEQLHIRIDNLNDESKRQFVKALGNLSELRVLCIFGFEGTVQSEWDRVVLSQHLQSLIVKSVVLRRLPSCINPARLPSLCYLDLFVEDIDEAGLRAVGGLPQLRRLELSTPRTWFSSSGSTATVVIAGDGFFQKLRRCSFLSWMVQFVVNEDSACVSFSLWNGKQQGALAAFGSSTEDESSSRSVPPTVMPNLQELTFQVPVRALYKDGNESQYMSTVRVPLPMTWRKQRLS
ncbi:disease resistance protein RGA5-like [Panicum virgatum]|uniref:disease resistance protein RGA5-like n=1 Tax=Panicum virgatum TaxID=38727 RepID=UPI0019D699EF|nr:disease resistance protein RGA5-like [Panicum virgatum]